MSASWMKKWFARPSVLPFDREPSFRNRRRHRLGIEALEERLAPALYSPGDDEIGTQTGSLALTADDTLQIDIDVVGGRADLFNVAGRAGLGGTLEVRLVNGNDPQVGTAYTIVRSTGSAGAFDKVTLPALAGGKKFVPLLEADQLTLIVAAGSRPLGGSQLRVPSNFVTDPLINFLRGVDASVQLPGVELSVLEQTVRGDFTFGAGLTASNMPVVAVSATHVSATLGNGLVTLSDGSATFILSNTGLAGEASASVAVQPGLGVSLSGTAILAMNTANAAFKESVVLGGQTLSLDLPGGPFVRVGVEEATLSVTVGSAIQSVGGSVVLETATETRNSVRSKVIRGFVADVSASLGSTGGPRVKVAEGSGGFVLMPQGIAAQFSGDVALEGASSDLTLAGTLRVGLNNTGLPVASAFTLSSGQTVGVDFTATGSTDVLEFGGALHLDVAGFVRVEGAFGFRQEGTTKLLVGVTDVNAFFGDPGASALPGDDTGLRITGGKLGVILNKNGENPSTYALVGSGEAELVGVAGLTLAARQVTIRKNTTSAAVESTSVPTPRGSVTVAFSEAEKNQTFVGGVVELSVGDYVSLRGSFGFSKTSDTDEDSGITTTKLLVGASGVSTFFGSGGGTANAIGVQVDNARLGLVVTRTNDADGVASAATYALDASSESVALVGITGLTLTGSVHVRAKSATEAAVNEEIAIPGEGDPIEVAFEETHVVRSFGGTLNLAVGDVVTLSGGLSFKKEVVTDGTVTTTTLVAAAGNVAAFVGTSDGGAELGVHLSGGTLAFKAVRVVDSAPGAEVVPTTYALDASGSVALVGLDPVSLGGTFRVRRNDTGEAFSETITVPNPAGGADLSVAADVPADLDLEVAGQQVTLGVAEVFTVAGDFSIRRATDGKLTVSVVDAGISIWVNRAPVITLGGGAVFTLGGTEGFALQSFTLAGFTFSPNGAGDTGGGNEGGTGGGSGGGSGEDPASDPPQTEGTRLGPLTIAAPSVKLEEFHIGRFDPSSRSLPLTAQVRIGVGRASLEAGPFSLVAEGLAGTFDVGVKLGLTSPFVSDFSTTGKWSLKADTVTAGIGDFLELKATDFVVDPGAAELVTFGSVSAKLTAGSVALAGTARNFAITSDGRFVAKSNFSVSLSMTDADPLGLSVLPIHINEVTALWPGDNFQRDPSNFRLIISAGVDGNFGPVQVSGSVDRLEIDVRRWRDGVFPIVGLQGFSVSAEGNLFGGKIKGSIIAGIIKTDAEGNVVDGASEDYTHTTFYAGIEGGFAFANIGADIRVGFTERGILSAYLDARAPITLEPISGLQLSGFRAGVSFNAPSLPDVTTPEQLLDPIFQPTTSLTAEQWAEQLKQQAANQVSGGSKIFTITTGVSAIVTELGTGVITSSSALAAAFRAAAYPLADADSPAASRALVAGLQWLVTYKGATYVVEKVNGALQVHKGRFALADGLRSALEEGSVSAAVIAAFAVNEVVLSPSATIAVVGTSGSVASKWKITDGGAEYFITARGDSLVVTGGGASFASMNDIVRIEAGATFTTQYVSDSVLAFDVDVIITTDGKFLILGKGTLASTLSVDARFYGDLTSIGPAHPNVPLKMVFLADFPAAPAPRLSRVQGIMTLEFTDAAGNLINPQTATPAGARFRVLGKSETGISDQLTAVFGGDAGPGGQYAELALTVSTNPAVTEVRLDVSGSLSIEGVIAADDLISAAGTLLIRKEATEPVEIFGAVKLNFDPVRSFPLLKKAGLKAADAELMLAFNTATETKDLTLRLPGRPAEVFHLAPTAVALEGVGRLQFELGVSQFGAYLEFDGAFAARLAVDSVAGSNPDDPTVRGDGGVDFELFVAGRLDVGLNAGGERLNLLRFDALGLIAIRDVGAVYQGQNLQPVLAARVDLFIQAGIPGVIDAQGSAQLLFNSGAADFVYVVPDSVAATVREVQTRRGVTPADQLAPADLPALRTTIVVPGGPRFSIELGDADEPTDIQPGGSAADHDGDGLVPVGVKILNAFQLTGSMRVEISPTYGFILTAQAKVNLALPGAEQLFSGNASGFLQIGPAGLVGGLEVTTGFSIPGISVSASRSALLGINTTSSDVILPGGPPNLDATLRAQSARLYLEGTLVAGGFSIDGAFALEVGASAIEMMVRAGMNLFDIGRVSVSGKAGIYYGSNPGLVFDARLGVSTGFGPASKIFEVGGDLTLHIDSRSTSQRFEIGLENARVKLLGVLEATGQGRIVASNGYFRVEGAFHGSLFNIITVGVAGYFDSEGNFALDLDGRFRLGTDSWGIQAAGSLHIRRDMSLATPIPLEFRAALEGRVIAAGVTLLGANIGVQYASPPSGDGAIVIDAGVTVLGIPFSVSFTVGYLRLEIPPTSQLASVDDTGLLTLNVGADGHKRNVSRDSTDEAYSIESIGPGSAFGDKVRVEAFGASQIFDNVTRIQGDFGGGNDQLVLGSSLGTFRSVTFTVSGGEGNDLLVNQSAASGNFFGNGGADTLVGADGPVSLLDAGEGDDSLYGGRNVTMLGGVGNDVLTWRTDVGRPETVDGGSDRDLLIVTGSERSETFRLLNNAGRLNVAVSGGATDATLAGDGLEAIRILARGGVDVLEVSSGALAAVGVGEVIADMGRVPGSGDNLTDDGLTDRVTLTATGDRDVLTIDPVDDVDENTHDVAVSLSGFTLTVKAPAAADVLMIDAGGGNDSITASAAANRLKLTVAGGEGDDTAVLPLGSVSFDGGNGDDALTLVAPPGLRGPLTLTAERAVSGDGTALFASVVSLAIEAPAWSGSATVQSSPAATTMHLGGGTLTVQGSGGTLDATLAGAGTAVVHNTGGNTRLTLGSGEVLVKGGTGTINVEIVGNGTAILDGSGGPAVLKLGSGTATINGSGGAVRVEMGGGGTVNARGASGALDIHLLGGGGTANIQRATAPVNVIITGGDAGSVPRVNIGATSVTAAVTVVAEVVQESIVNLGAGLLSRVHGPVTLTDVDRVEFDNSLDGAGGVYAISDAGVVYNGQTYAAQNARVLVLRTGLGDDTVTSTAGQAAQSVTDFGGTDRLDVTLVGNPDAINPFNPGDYLVRSTGTETVAFGHVDLGAVEWRLSGSSLSTAATRVLERDGRFALSLGDGGDTLDIDHLSADTTVDVGGGSNAVIVRTAQLDHTLRLVGGATGNRLTIDDTDSEADTARALAISPGAIVPEVGRPITFAPTAFSNLAVQLGGADDTVTVTGLPATTSITGGEGGDVFNLSGSLNSLTVSGEGGADTFSLTMGSGNLLLDGGADRDTVALDRSDAVTGLAGSLGVDGAGKPVVALSGLPSFAMPSSSPAELLRITLGAGNDTFQVDSAGYAPEGVELIGGAGDDAFTFRSVGGAVNTFEVTGGTGQDTLTLTIAGNVADRPFMPVVPHVERLVIDHSAGTAGTAWEVEGSSVLASQGGPVVGIIDAEGAGRVDIIGGSSLADTLTVAGSSASFPVQLTLDGRRVVVDEGLSVLSQSSPPMTGPTAPLTVDGLDSPLSVVASSDGKLVFAVTARGVSVFRAEASSGTLIYASKFDLPGGLYATSAYEQAYRPILAVRPDGRWLFLAVAGGFHVFEVNSLTATLAQRQFIAGSIRGLGVSPDGTTLAVITTTGLATYAVGNLASGANPLGTPAAVSPFTGDGVWFSNDSAYLYTRSSEVANGVRSLVLVLQRQADLSYTRYATLPSGSGLRAYATGDLYVSSDGAYLFGLKDGQLDYFRLGDNVAGTTDADRLRRLGGLTGVASFAYLEGSQTLVVHPTTGGRVYYPFDPGTGTLGAPTVAGGTRTFLTTRIAANPDGTTTLVYTAADRVEWQTVATGDDVAAAPVMGADAPAGASFASAQPMPGVSGVGGILAVGTAPDQVNSSFTRLVYTVVDPDTGAVLDEQLSEITIRWADAVAVAPVAYGNRLVWWAVERFAATTQNLVRYSYSPATGIQVDGSENVNTLESSLVAGLVFTPDGRSVYLYGSSSTRRYVLNATGTPDNFVPFSSATATGFAFAGGQMYRAAIQPGINEETTAEWIDRLALPADGSTDVYGAVQGESYNARDLSLVGLSVLSVASADGGMIYVHTGRAFAGAAAGLYSFRLSTLGGMVAYAPAGRAESLAPNYLLSGPEYRGQGGMVLRDGTLHVAGGITLGRYSVGPDGVAAFVSRSDFSDQFAPVAVQGLTVAGGYVFATLRRVESEFFRLLAVPVGVGSDVSLRQGQVIGRGLTGVTASAVSPDGRYRYAYSAADRALGVYDATADTWTTFFDGYEVPVGALRGAVAITVREVSGVLYAALVSPTEGTLTVFRTEAGVTTVASQLTSSQLVGVQAVTLAPDGKFVIVTDTVVRAYDASVDFSALGTAETLYTGAGLSGVYFGNGRTYVVAGGGTQIHAVSSGASIAQVGGLAEMRGLAIDGTTLYAVSAEGRLLVLRDSGTTLAVMQTVVNETDGVSGLGGATAVTLSPDGQYVFLAGTGENSIAVFARTANGTVRFVQNARDGRAADGIARPTGLYVITTQEMGGSVTRLLVASGAGRNGRNGGFALLDIADIGAAVPASVETTFTGVEGLTLQGGNFGDVVRVVAAAGPAVPVTIRTGAGGDAVVIADSGAAGSLMSIETGAGTDEVTVNQAIAHASGAASTMTIDTGADNDRVFLAQLAASLAVGVDLSASGTETDIVQVRGRGVPGSSTVAIQGNPSTAGGFVGDALIYDGNGAGFVGGAGSSGSNDNIVLGGQGPVTFTGLNKTTPTQQVFLVAAPQPTVSPPASIAEGQGVTLSASDASNQTNVVWEWDLNGDGVFGDAVGQSVALSWEQLRGFDINDGPRVYPVAVRATTTQNAVSFGGEVIRLAAEAAGLLTVNDASPTLTPVPTGATATLGLTFALPLGVVDPGNDRVTRWVIQWGDGTAPETFGAEATLAPHVYAEVGSYTIQVTAINEDGNFTVSGTVSVRPGAGSVRLASYSATLIEGESFAATVEAIGTPVRYRWSVGSGFLDTTTPTLALTWANLVASFGVADNGTFPLSVTAFYSDGSTEYPALTAPVTFTVGNAAPSGSLVLSGASVQAGSASGTVTIRAEGYSDPSPLDTASSASVNFDFDNNGTIDLVGVAVGTNVAVPGSVLTTAGFRTIRAVLRDKDGGESQLFATFEVTLAPLPPAPPLPTVSLDSLVGIAEGAVASVTARVHGSDAAVVTSWLVNWGDGTVEEVAAALVAGSQTFAHRYLDDGVYSVAVTARTASGEVSATGGQTVFDVAPTVQLSVPTATGQGDLVRVTWTTSDPGEDRIFDYMIHWGDNTSDIFTGDIASATHVYSTVPPLGTYLVQMVAVTNDDGTFANVSAAVPITVANAGPRLPVGSLDAGTYTVGFTTPVRGLVASVSASRSGVGRTLDVLLPGSADAFTVGRVVGPVGLVRDTFSVAPVALPGAPQGSEWVRLTYDSDIPEGAYSVGLLAASGGQTQVSATLDVPASSLVLTFHDPIGSLPVNSIARIGRGLDEAIYSVVSAAPVSPDAHGWSATWQLSFRDRLFVPTTGTEGVAIDLSASAVSVRSGSEPLTFRWEVVAPGGTRSVTTTRVASPLSVLSLSASAAGVLSALEASVLDVTGAGVTVVWTLTDAQGGVTTLQGAAVSAALLDGVYQVALSASSASGTVTAAGVLRVAAGVPTFDALAGLGGVLRSNASTSPGYEFAATNGMRFTPLDDGSYTVILTVTDDDGATTSTTRVISVANASPTIDTFVVPATGSEGEPFAFSASASDLASASDSLTYAWTVTDTATGQTFGPFPGLAGTFTPYGGTFVVRLEVTDGDGGTASRSGRILVANLAPTVVAGSLVVPASAIEGETSTFRVAGSDAGGRAVTYRWRVVGPAGAATFLDGSEVTFTWPDDGAYLVEVVLDDGQGGRTGATTTVSVANAAPQPGGATVPSTGTEGVALALTASATDAGPVDALTYLWTITPAGGEAFLLYGPAVSFVPTDDGSYSVMLTVRDGDGGEQIETLGPIVVGNVAPVFTEGLTAPAGSPSQGQTVRLVAPGVTDVAADLPVVYEWTVTPARGAAFPLTGSRIDVPLEAGGTYTVEVVAVDRDGGRSEAVFVSFAVMNLDPTVTAFVVPARGFVDKPMALEATATDGAADLPHLSYAWTVVGPSGTVFLNGLAPIFTPTVAGAHTVSLTVSDGAGGSVTRTAQVDVATSPVAIRAFQVAGTAVEASPVRMTGAADDALGGAVTLTWSIATPSGETIMRSGADVSFTPPDNGDYLVTLTAISANGSATTSQVVRVTNALPVLTTVMVPDTARGRTPIALSATGLDPAGVSEGLVYSWTITAPSGASFVLSGAETTFTPTELGDYGVRLVVRDKDGGQAVAQRYVAVYLGAELRIDPVSAERAEGTGGTTAFTFAVTLSNPIDYLVTVQVTTAGLSATPEVDFGSVSRTLTFRPGESLTQLVTVEVAADATVEPNEHFVVRLSDATFNGDADPERVAVVVSEVEATIVNDDVSAVSVARRQDGAEGGAAGVFRVNLSNPSATDTVVRYSVSGTAASNDYEPPDGTVTILAGQTYADILISVVDDTRVEGDETVGVVLTDVESVHNEVFLSGDLSAELTLCDNDRARIAFASPTSQVDESVGSHQVDVELVIIGNGQEGVGTLERNVQVRVTAPASGSADLGIAQGGDLFFASGEASQLRQVTLDILSDALSEGDEAFSLSLSGLQDGTDGQVTLGDDHVLTLRDDDVDVQVSVTGPGVPVTVGSGLGNLEYSVTVHNMGQVTATHLVIRSVWSLPAGVRLTGTEPAQGFLDADGLWHVGTLPSGGTTVLRVVLTADASVAHGTPPVEWSASVASVDLNRVNTGDDSATAAASLRREVDLAVSQVGGTGRVMPGNLIVYSFTVRNAGPSNATGVMLRDVVPARTTFVAARSSPGWSVVSGVAQYVVGDLPAGQSVVVQFAVRVDQKVPVSIGRISNVVTVLQDGSAAEPVVANNTAAQQTPVNRVPVGPPRRFDLWANEPLNVPAVRGLLSSVKDVDGDRLRAVLVQPPSSGLLRLNNNGSFRYEPRRSFHGVVTFRYRVFDGFRFSEPIVVTLHIQPHGRRSF